MGACGSGWLVTKSRSSVPLGKPMYTTLGQNDGSPVLYEGDSELEVLQLECEPCFVVCEFCRSYYKEFQRKGERCSLFKFLYPVCKTNFEFIYLFHSDFKFETEVEKANELHKMQIVFFILETPMQ